MRANKKHDDEEHNWNYDLVGLHDRGFCPISLSFPEFVVVKRNVCNTLLNINGY